MSDAALEIARADPAASPRASVLAFPSAVAAGFRSAPDGGTPGEWALERVRRRARSARLARRVDPEGFWGAAPLASDAAGAALIAVLDRTARRPLRIARRETRPATFDEMWLCRLLDACRRGDGDTARFLIAGRAPREARIVLGRLAARAAAGRLSGGPEGAN